MEEDDEVSDCSGEWKELKKYSGNPKSRGDEVNGKKCWCRNFLIG